MLATGVPAAATRAVALRGAGAGAAAGAAASGALGGVLGGVRAVRRDVDFGEVVVVFYDVRDAVRARDEWGAAGVAVRFVEAGGGVQVHGTVVVFGLEAGEEVTREVVKVFGAFGEIREVRETPGKRGHRFVEYFDARDAERVVGRGRVEVGGRRVKIEGSVRASRKVREEKMGWEEEDEEVEEAGRIAEGVGRVVVEEDEEEEDAGFLRGRLRGRRGLGAVGDAVWEGSSGSGSWGARGVSASPEREVASPPFSPVSMAVAPGAGSLGREEDGGLMRELQLLQGAGAAGRATGGWGGFETGFAAMGLGVVVGRSPRGIHQGGAPPLGGVGEQIGQIGQSQHLDMQHAQQVQQRYQAQQLRHQQGALQMQLQRDREWEVEKEREKERERKLERNFEALQQQTERSPPVETRHFQLQQQQQSRYGGGHNGHSGNSHIGRSYNGINLSGHGHHHSQSAGNSKFALALDKVRSGGDTRTALMIRNIPNKYSSKMLLAALEESHRGHFDFLYLPIDFKNKCNVGYAFINFTAPRHIIPFYAEFHGRKWGKFNSDKVCEIAYARIQGKQQLINHFSNSSLMNEDPKCRPVVFAADGSIEEFPVGLHVRTRRGPSARDAARLQENSPSHQASQAFSPGRQRGRCN